jgi:hypothetical protein
MKNGCECFDKLSMHGFSSGNSSFGPLVLSLSKDSERVFQQPASESAGWSNPGKGTAITRRVQTGKLMVCVRETPALSQQKRFESIIPKVAKKQILRRISE